MSSRPIRIAITPGEPAGIGPDLCLQLVQRPLVFQPVFICDPALLAERAQLLGLACNIQDAGPAITEQPHQPGTCRVLPVTLAAPASCGRPDPANAQYVLDTIAAAVSGCRDGQFDAMVTGPVHKGVINDAGIPFTGHTEFIAAATGTEHVVMLLATDELRVALLTTHVPLSQVSELVTEQRLERVALILHTDLVKRFGIARPRIRACGLNPHAGEDGHLGREELDIMQPALTRLRDDGIDIDGPWPADTVFNPDSIAACDVILAMYHDQGLPVLKHSGFGRAVNITLGLPIIRTSVDHGTALELAGTGEGNTGSLEAALRYAVRMTNRSL